MTDTLGTLGEAGLRLMALFVIAFALSVVATTVFVLVMNRAASGGRSLRVDRR